MSGMAAVIGISPVTVNGGRWRKSGHSAMARPGLLGAGGH